MKLQNFLIVFFSFNFLGFSQTIELQSFGTGFSSPIEIAHAGDDRLFIVEQAGIIKILNTDGTINPTPFLDINSIVGSGGETGLLGLAFAPNYNTTGRFYVNYINNSGNTVISRFNVSANSNIANTTETILLSINQPFGNHNGGKLAFGQDGFLYIATGDGGDGGDPGNRAQNTTTLLGKILRIDVSGTTYSIPTSNPFSNSANGPNDARPEIYAIGLRNPWKFSFDKTNNDLWIADVGQGAYEEINKVTGPGSPGDNYGWRCYEGINHDYNNSSDCPIFTSTISPVAEYDHSNGKCSITGGYIYRGSTYSSFIGKYFFADYCSREIGILTNTGSNWSMTLQTPNISQNWTTFGEDFNGELYIAGGSNIYKITDANLSTKEGELFNFKLYPNPARENIFIDLSNRFNDVELISVYNIHGQRVIDISKPNKQTINLSTKNFKSGLYFLEVNLENSSKITKKLIIN
ncbi:Por secretion system C-terminal sorting domain-containing protein [Flaviramulus basaltis]|uniref:Por secretion system C-terminal sorting domain-containing protein n=1 Tax=Flaviramulus basaltis TaxID=369401 RepID=A0A1K2IIG6_9FLAO|nr:PQQ-dependent sugar dehydrogenase [Flaviramulus basaltis]SFZ92191.1 Por secretion system C-terminal sorting domain-containing protein [Flaviramulus basaltis]